MASTTGLLAGGTWTLTGAKIRRVIWNVISFREVEKKYNLKIPFSKAFCIQILILRL
jgi:hypothetical protein